MVNWKHSINIKQHIGGETSNEAIVKAAHGEVAAQKGTMECPVCGMAVPHVHGNSPVRWWQMERQNFERAVLATQVDIGTMQEVAKDISTMKALMAQTYPCGDGFKYRDSGVQKLWLLWQVRATQVATVTGPSRVSDAARTIATSYECGTLATLPETNLGATIHLHYSSPADAENAFEALSGLIDAALIEVRKELA